jgi:SAM-dependent methyltransferase
MKIQALHEFHDADFSKEWTEKFKPTPPRLKLFELMVQQIEHVGGKNAHVLELGIGPGFLAHHILDNLPDITYEGLDFSKSMLEIAKKRTEKHKKRIDFIQADLLTKAWKKRLKKTPGVIVSTWALHDLFDKKNIFNVYKTVYDVLLDRGLLLNGDFIKPEESQYDYEGGRIKPSEHLELLRKCGFQDPECIEEFEKSVDNPTTANNYACFKAIK